MFKSERYFCLLNRRLFFVVLLPYILQLFYAVYNYYYVDVSFIYFSFFVFLSFFLFANKFVAFKLKTVSVNEKTLFLIKLIFVFLSVFKLYQFFKVFSSGVGFDQIRNFYFNDSDRFSTLYMDSKLILYVMFYIYPTMILFLFLNSLYYRKNVFLWGGIYIADGLLTAGRFNIYIMLISFFLMNKTSYKKILMVGFPILLLSGMIQLLRGDAGFTLDSTISSIVDYHVAPVAIFNESMNTSFSHDIPGDTFFSGVIYLLKPIWGGELQWQQIQDYLQNNWVLLFGTDKYYNAFGNILLFSYWDFLWVGPVFVAFLYSFFFRVKTYDSDPVKILLVWLGMLIYFSSLKMKMFSPECIIFILMFISVYKVRFDSVGYNS